MKRRGFLAALAASLPLDPERALWVPGAKLISVPKPRPLPISGISLMREHQRELNYYNSARLHVFFGYDATMEAEVTKIRYPDGLGWRKFTA